MSVYAAIGDHIRDLVLNEICPTANIDITNERGGLTIRIDNMPCDNAIDELLAWLDGEADAGTQDALVEPADGTAPATNWFVYVHITRANSAPLVIIQRVLTDEPVTLILQFP